MAFIVRAPLLFLSCIPWITSISGFTVVRPAASPVLKIARETRTISGQPRTIRHKNIILATNEIPDTIDCSWSPQDLTKDVPGFLPIPPDDYVKKYQAHPELWPVEFFVIVYRRILTNGGKISTQILVRESANGTSKWGLGTGVPATRWMLSTQQPPRGYQWFEPSITFEASHFPEFPKTAQEKSWTYRKIDICEDAFNGPSSTAAELKDPKLEEYANNIRIELRKQLAEMMKNKNLDSWEATRLSVVKDIVENTNSLAAIQGTLRMSGIFADDTTQEANQRYVSLGKDAPDPTQFVQSMRIYTMFPQMPDPMPAPTTPPDELQKEIASRDSVMEKTGRDPHKDKHGRKYTHKSTSNVSNTIHGVYFTLDATDLLGHDNDDDSDRVPPALDLFGTKRIKREWKSLEDLKVLGLDGETISTEDTKPTFISGFIARQLVEENVIDIRG